MTTRNPDASTEVDDYKHAVSISESLQGATPAMAFEIMAQWIATLRLYYVEIGRELERDANNA